MTAHYTLKILKKALILSLLLGADYVLWSYFTSVRAQGLETQEVKSESQCEEILRKRLISQLKALYPKDTRLEITNLDLERSGKMCGVMTESLTFVYGPIAGKAAYAYKLGPDSSGHCIVTHRALRKGLISKRRYRPGDPLIASDFTVSEVDVAQYLPFEAKQEYLAGPIVDGNYEAYATILEGRPLLAQHVKTAPKIRKGDRVLIEIKLGGVVLEATGIAQEPGYLKQPLRVLYIQGKKELTGLVSQDGRVQVSL